MTLQVTLSTAHPAKFKDTVSNLLNNEKFITDKVHNIMELEEDMIIIENSADAVKTFIMENI